MRRIISAVLALLVMMSLCACAFAEPPEITYKDNLTAVIASDLHYISPEINDNGEYFTKMMAEADGKVSIYCDELTDAFLSEVIEQKPDFLILTGDLSFNGELPSHMRLAEKLAVVEQHGIQVLVTTGNHDIEYYTAASFSGGGYTLLDPTGQAEFREIYAEFGYDEAEAADTDSLSYLYRAGENTWFIVLDTNTPGRECLVSDETLNWVEKQLAYVRAEGGTVIGIGHQNLMRHSMFSSGYVIDGADRLLDLYEKYGVELCFSGHLHIQHIMTGGNVTEITSSSLCVTPCQYGVLTLGDGKASYKTKPVDVSAWAEENGSTDANLLHFSDFAADYMDTITATDCEQTLAEADLTQVEKAAMTAYACEVNRMYFAGDLTGLEPLDPTGRLRELWTGTDAFFAVYLDSITEDAGNDYRIFSIKGRTE